MSGTNTRRQPSSSANTSAPWGVLTSEVESHADLSCLRYAQCWEDADVLVAAARIKSSDNVVSICSAGDNTLALLAQSPRGVVAIDMSSAQLASLEFRVAALAELSYEDMLDVLGVTHNNKRRMGLYLRIRKSISPGSRSYWDSRRHEITSGVLDSGKFESYFRVFRNVALPLVHRQMTVDALLQQKSPEERLEFFRRRWNSPQWRAMFSVFFSRRIMGSLGREGSFFNYVDANVDVAENILQNTNFALTQLAPSENPYLHWILKGSFGSSLPFYLRRENFHQIKANLHRLTWQQSSLETYLSTNKETELDVVNLSDIFEYMSPACYERLLTALVESSRPGARFIYWNMLVDRQCPDSLSKRIHNNTELAGKLFSMNKTFFYKRLVVEELVC